MLFGIFVYWSIMNVALTYWGHFLFCLLLYGKSLFFSGFLKFGAGL